MDLISMAAKYIVKKGLTRAGYQIAHGMGPKKYLKSRMQVILDAYGRDGTVTYELVKLFAHGVSQEDLVEVAEAAGVRSILKDIFNSNDIFYRLFESDTYDFIVNYFYYTEELGKTIAKKELDGFFNTMRQAVKVL